MPSSDLPELLEGVLIGSVEAAALDVHGRTDAAVLVPLFLNADGEPSVVLTRRREDLRRHPGEISFPGGRQDPEDTNLSATALREAHEEIGLDPAASSSSARCNRRRRSLPATPSTPSSG